MSVVFTSTSKRLFDSVSLKILLGKMAFIGFDKKFLALVESYLSNRSQKVRVCDFCSEPGAVTSGVPQGSILGPLVLLIFVKDLPDSVTNTICYLYVDDQLGAM